MNRRDFIKLAGTAVGGAMLSGGISACAETTMQMKKEAEITSDPLLKGVCDIHIHAAPDTRARLIDELSFARDCRKAGYRSVLFKSNDWSCHDRMFLIREVLPDFKVFGSFCMNFCCGDRVNVYAAEQAVKTTGNFCRCIWLPTQASDYQRRTFRLSRKGIPVLDEKGRVLPEVARVMEICSEADIILASGHSAPEESLVLAAKAKEIGLKKFVITHANSGIWKMTHDQIRRAIDLGAWIEYSCITNYWGPGTGLPDFVRMGSDEFSAFAKINPERSFITTDLGQVGMPHPIQGMRTCIRELLNAGIPQKSIDLMVRSNPAHLIGLNKNKETFL